MKKFLLSGLMIVALLQVANASAPVRKRIAPIEIDQAITRLASTISDPERVHDAEIAIDQLVSGRWCTDQLAKDIAGSHYISDTEMRGSPGTHGVRIIVGRGDKTAQVKANLEHILAAVKADEANGFSECTVLQAPHAGEIDFYFGSAGLATLEGISIAVHRRTHWKEDSSLKIVGVRIAKGTTSLAHFYPLFQ